MFGELAVCKEGRLQTQKIRKHPFVKETYLFLDCAFHYVLIGRGKFTSHFAMKTKAFHF